MGRSVGEVYFEVGARLEGLNQGLKVAGSAVSELARKWEVVGKQFSATGQKMSLFLTAPITALGVTAVKSAGQIEMLESQFTTMLHSADAAKTMIGDLRTMAAKTPFETSDLASATTMLMGFGVAGNDVLGVLQQLGDVARGDAVKLNSVALAYGQIMAQGAATMQDLRQLINAGVPIFNELGKSTGKSTAELMKMTSEGKITADVIKKAFSDMTGAGGTFYKGMENASKTFQGVWSTMKDDITNALVSIADLFMPTIKSIISGISDFAQSINGWSDEAKTMLAYSLMIVAALGPGLMLVSKLVGMYSAFGAVITGVSVAMAGNQVATNASGLTLIAHAVATKAAQAASLGFIGTLKAVAAAMLTNPITLMLTALVGLGAVVYALITKQERYVAALQKEAQLHADNAKNVNALVERYNALAEKKSRTVQEEEEFHNVLLQLSQTVPGLTLKYDEQGRVIGANIEKVKEYADAENAKSKKERENLKVTLEAQIATQEAKVNAYEQAMLAEDGQLEAEARANAKKRGLNEEETNALIVKYKTEQGWIFKSREYSREAFEEKKRELDATRQKYNENNVALSALIPVQQKVAELQKKQAVDAEAAAKWQKDKEEAQKKWVKFISEAGKSEIELRQMQYERDYEELADANRRKLISDEQYVQAAEALEKKKNDDIQKMNEETNRKINEQRVAAMNGATNVINTGIGQVSEIMGMYYSNQSALIENEQYKKQKGIEDWYTSEQAAINNSVTSTSERNARLKALDEEKARRENDLNVAMEKKKRELARKSAKMTRDLAIFETTINIPTAAVNAYKSAAEVPLIGYILAPIAAAAAVAFGVAKLSMLAATPLPALARGGYFSGPAVIGEAGREFAFPLDGPQGQAAMSLMADRLLDSLSARLSRYTEPDRSASVVQQSFTGGFKGMVLNLFADNRSLGEYVCDVVHDGTNSGQLILNARAVK